MCFETYNMVGIQSLVYFQLFRDTSDCGYSGRVRSKYYRLLGCYVYQNFYFYVSTMNSIFSVLMQTQQKCSFFVYKKYYILHTVVHTIFGMILNIQTLNCNGKCFVLICTKRPLSDNYETDVGRALSQAVYELYLACVFCVHVFVEPTLCTTSTVLRYVVHHRPAFWPMVHKEDLFLLVLHRCILWWCTMQLCTDWVEQLFQ